MKSVLFCEEFGAFVPDLDVIIHRLLCFMTEVFICSSAPFNLDGSTLFKCYHVGIKLPNFMK